jgi:hypothetical protein
MRTGPDGMSARGVWHTIAAVFAMPFVASGVAGGDSLGPRDLTPVT